MVIYGSANALHCLSATDLNNINNYLGPITGSNTFNGTIMITSADVSYTFTNIWNMAMMFDLYVCAPRHNLPTASSPEEIILQDLDEMSGVAFSNNNIPIGTDIFKDCPRFVRAWRVLKKKSYRLESGQSTKYTYRRRNYREKVQLEMAPTGPAINSNIAWYKYFSRVFLLVLKGFAARTTLMATNTGPSQLAWTSSERYEFVMEAPPNSFGFHITDNLASTSTWTTIVPGASTGTNASAGIP